MPTDQPPAEIKTLDCLTCGQPLAPVVNGGRALQLLGGLITGKTSVKCSACGKVRPWKPEPLAGQPA